MISIAGYQVLDKIYESSNSQVFRAVRHLDSLPVVLKVLNPDYPTPQEVIRYRQEYRITRGLEQLSGIIGVYGMQRYRNTLAMILEDFGGTSCDILMETREFTLREFLVIAVRTAEILGGIHRQDVIHKDVNPSNIVLNPETGELKIIDFGISTALSRENPVVTNPDKLEGTPAYISPEQTGRMNRSIDYRTDYYSLGAAFYEMLAGRPPFETTDTLELVHCHIARLPAAPHEVKAGVPETVSHVVMRLLSKNAEERYQSSAGLRADLEECLRQLDTDGDIESFALGCRDVPERFRIPQKLYGREAEIETLVGTFEHVSSGHRAMMLVSGHPGIGKTSLVNEIYRPVTKHRGNFISGKFDQFQRRMPYSAIVSAFRDLVRQILSESPERLAYWRERLPASFGPNGRVIVDVIPEVELIVGPQPPVPALGPVESQNRFNLVFRNFVQVFCQAAHPLVVFLDDLQWADTPSLKLLELMVTDSDNRYLYLVGAYRDSEVDAAHPLAATINTLRAEDAPLKSIVLGPLTAQHVAELISEALRSDTETVKPLVDLVTQKTGGNPFFVNEFLQSLYVEGLLELDPQRGAWQWSLDRIRARGITDNVIELMAARIHRLSERTQGALKLAACIGNPFDVEILAPAHQASPKETIQSLAEAVDQGLVVPLGDGYKSVELDVPELSGDGAVEYRFCHDRIQQAAYSLISDEDKPSFHRNIGRMLLENTEPSRLDLRIFDIVNQLNQGARLIDEESERRRLAGLNLSAGKKARDSAAFEPAFDYLKSGLSLLGDDCWHASYELALDLHVEAAQAAYLNGDWEEMERLSSIVTRQARTILDEVKVHEVRIQAYFATGRLLDAAELGLRVLKQLGVKYPSRPNKPNTLLSLLRTKVALAGKEIEDLIDLPEMTDPVKLATMRVLSTVSVPVYYALPGLLPFLIFTLVRLSVKYGNTSRSPYGYAAYGMILCGAVGDIDSGHRFGRLAIHLQERLNVKELMPKTAFVVNFFTRHWKEHLRDLSEPFTYLYQTALETGDFEFAALSGYARCLYSYFVGQELAELEPEMDACNRAMERMNQTTTLRHGQLVRQAMLCFMGRCEDPRRLMGESYNEDVMLPVHRDTHEIVAIFHVYFHKLILSYHFHAYHQAVEYASEAEKNIDGIIGQIHVPVLYFYDSLARLALYESSSGFQRRQILSKVLANQRKMKKWARHSPMNYLHKYYLVEAERLRVTGKEVHAAGCYENAVSCARNHEYLNEEALALELAAKFQLAKGNTSMAATFMQDARYCYHRWGAEAKVKDLDERYRDLLADGAAGPPERRRTTKPTGTAKRTCTSETGAAEVLDLESVMKASQAISGEIDLRNLLDRLIKIVIENAGAERGFLILDDNGILLVQAEGSADVRGTTVLQSIPIEECKRLSSAIVHYTARTKESLVLADAAEEGRFTRDPYVVENRPVSILCTPLILKGELKGVLYLENNLAAGAFTPARLRTLRLLSTQAAISLENARLYEQRKQAEDELRAAGEKLEIRVEERTAELVRANKHLEREIAERKRAQKELASALEAAKVLRAQAETASRFKGEFLENMSHEIRSPVNAITGMAELLLDSDLDDRQRELLEIMNTLGESLLALTSDILDLSKIEAGMLDLKQTDFRITETLADTISMLQARAREKHLALRSQVPQRTPDRLRGDPDRLRQIVVNLVNNAIKYTDKGEIVFGFHVQEVLDDEVVLHFVVSDTGLGIPPDKLETIFERFSQAESSSGKRGGAGLGLAISRQLVKAMGGEIWAESEAGKGSTFHFTARFKSLDPVDGLGISAAQAQTAEGDLAGLKVLLAEDNEINQIMVQRTLESLGCDVVVVSNGREAVAAFDSQRFDAILMDLQMPEMDGLEATRLIREKERGSRVPIIAQTAHAFGEYRDICMAAGMDDHVSKPVRRTDLERLLMKATSSGDRKGRAGPNASRTAAGNPPTTEDRQLFDSEDLLKRLDGDREALPEMVELFFAHVLPQVDELRTASVNEDWEVLARISHTLKGACATFGSPALCSTAGGIEKAAKERDAAAVHSLLYRLGVDLESLKQSVSSFIKP